MQELQTITSPATVTITQDPSVRQRALGEKGEASAAAYLERRGWEVVARNWRCNFGEADIVALDPERDEGPTVFVEVKTRSRRDVAPVQPEEAVDDHKQERYRNIARCYLRDHPGVSSVRFDVISVEDEGCGRAHLRHYINAYDADI